jgi:hypothetical protein
MRSSDAGDVDSDGNSRQAAGKKPARRDRKLVRRADVKAPRIAAAGQRVQKAAHDGLAVARKEAAERTVDAARKAKQAALPRWAQARDGVRQRIAVNPEVAEQVTLALMMAVIGAAAEHSDKIHPAAKLVGPAIAATVGPRVATRTAGTIRKGFEKLHLQDTPSAVEPAEQAKETGDAAAADIKDTRGPSSASTAQALSELADAFGVRRPPDPEALYRPGTNSLEMLFPLPSDLASVPWSSLSHRNRFFVLVAAWALRETDGIQLLRVSDFEQADEVFQECLIRAEHMQTPELIARSYEDLAELAVVSGNEAAARKWRAAAESAEQG